MFDKMPNIFSGSSIVFVLSHTMFYMCLTLLALIGSLVLGNLWYTRSFALILISKTYVIFICYVTNPTRRHIGMQIRTTDTIHTLAYQVIPTSLNRRTQNCEDLPPDYQVSCHDLYVEDILFNYHLPAIGQPNAEEDEVPRPEAVGVRKRGKRTIDSSTALSLGAFVLPSLAFAAGIATATVLLASHTR